MASWAVFLGASGCFGAGAGAALVGSACLTTGAGVGASSFFLPISSLQVGGLSQPASPKSVTVRKLVKRTCIQARGPAGLSSACRRANFARGFGAMAGKLLRDRTTSNETGPNVRQGQMKQCQRKHRKSHDRGVRERDEDRSRRT